MRFRTLVLAGLVLALGVPSAAALPVGPCDPTAGAVPAAWCLAVTGEDAAWAAAVAASQAAWGAARAASCIAWTLVAGAC